MITMPIGVPESGEWYAKFPDGTLIQWGNGSAGIGESEVIVKYKIQFVNDNVGISVCPGWVSDSKVFVTYGAYNNAYKSGVAFYITDYSLELTKYREFRWMAIGRWK